MSYEYLNDNSFLEQLDFLKLQVQYTRLTLLSYEDKIVGEIQGQITGGSVSVNGSSAVRRTISLTMLATEYNAHIEKLNNQISLNKKVKVEVGYKNPFNKYAHYGEIIWFPCGIYLISGASVARSTGGWTISINGKDKMGLLDGTVGGTLPASVAFHEIYEQTDSNSQDIIIKYPTIYQIIQEAVHHYGKENINNIIINDLDLDATMLIQYVGEEPIYFNSDYTVFTFNKEEVESWGEGNCRKFVYGQDVGYKATEFTYPGELILNAGETVASLLDKIAKTLGNYEYFYDIEGRFVFQQIKNYLNVSSPLKELQATDYIRSYSNTKHAYSFTNLETISSININPKYDNIKNDFIVWGSRKSAAGNEIAIRYHVAIDSKPSSYYSDLYMQQKIEIDEFGNQHYSILTWPEDTSDIESILNDNIYFPITFELDDYFEPNIYYIQKEGQKSQYVLADTQDEETTYYAILKSYDGEMNQEIYESQTFYYYPADSEGYGYKICKWSWDDYNALEPDVKPTQLYHLNRNVKYEYIGPPINNYEWREELYRRAIVANAQGDIYSNYDEELLAEWRKLYDPLNETWEEYDYWNPFVLEDSRQIDYWLDFIDENSAMGKYSIANIGRRTKVLNANDANSVYNPILESPILFNYMEEGYSIPDTFDASEYIKFQVPKQYSDIFIPSTTGTSCFDKIRELLYQNLTYNTSITISCLPKYYMEPNNILYIQDKASGIDGNYVISQFSLPLAQNGTMSITATEALIRV